MKILISGGDKVYSIENLYVKYLREAGVEVELFPAQSIFYDFYQKSLLNKLLFKARLSGVYHSINREFKAAVNRFQPHAIWVFKGMEIFPSTLRWAKEKGIYLANYNADNPFIFTDRGSGNPNVTNSIGLFDLHFTYNLDVMRKLKEATGCATAYLPFGFDVSEELYQACAREEEVVTACFLGNPDAQRAAFISALADRVPIDVYGNNWERFLHHPNVTVQKPVYGDELWKVLRIYRAQLNLMRVHNMDSHNMRSFEVPGIGGILVAPATTEHKMFFEDGQEVFLYDDVASCAEKISYALGMSRESVAMIRNNARSASLERGYDYRSRAAYVLEVFRKMLPSSR